MDIRVGHGYDLHRLATQEESGQPMMIGGALVTSPVGPIAHSDGDGVLHAVTDAILAAIGDDDLGTLFPDTAPENENRASKEFLLEAMDRLNAGGWAIGNIDITVLCDEPNIAKHKEQILDSLKSLLGAPVNIKGKTHEGTNRNGAIEVFVVALIQKGLHS
jgi:2-C-methyl-D-erythritol 2,4-cyclodiphosphate synthase